MSHPPSTYSFLPWLRQGLANQITAPDHDNTVKARASVDVSIQLTGDKVGGGTLAETVSRQVALYGPGDVQGLDTRAIVRAEPRHWATNFEPNYLTHIEFYEEDMPWRYTPAAADSNGRMRPWIMLVVLREGEFVEPKNIKDKPLPFIEVPDLAVFPPADELWAWAHVHVNRSLATGSEVTSTDMAAVLPKLQEVLNENRDLAYSRIVSPRRLDPGQAYHAFLMPVFETGRLTGLGLDPTQSPFATFSAWQPYPVGTRSEGVRFPYYYRWFFRTGGAGDFESLVRLLQPKPVDHRVGRRNMDTQAPGSNIRGLDNLALKGILKLGGALRVPRVNFTDEERAEFDRYENWATPFPRPLQEDLSSLVNLSDDYAQEAALAANQASGLGIDVQNDPDPLITPPIYGMWHAMAKRLLKERNGTAITTNKNWLHELNLDPRFRVAAGFGTRVVQDQQEQLMARAWEQIGNVLDANRKIRGGQFAVAVSSIWWDRHLKPLTASSSQKSLMLTAPMNKRVMSGEVTMQFQLAKTFLQPPMVSAQMRRVTRSRGRLVRTIGFNQRLRVTDTLARVMSGQVSAALPKERPSGLPILNDVVTKFSTPNVPREIFDAMREENRIPGSLDRVKQNANFKLMIGFDQRPAPFREGAENEAGRQFRVALEEVNQVMEASARVSVVPPKTRMEVSELAQNTLQAIRPDKTIPKRVLANLTLPARVKAEIGEQFVEAMAYPEFDTPMYEQLKKLSDELFLPNINLLEQNSITLLETNQKFIESYMVGLNHEFARELVWREYPTDSRGSYFRQFWDPSGFLNVENLTSEQLKDKLRDIPPLHLWSKNSKLGDHDNRQQGGTPKEEAVLVIRGELLKRYPTAVIYAHRACWQRKRVTAADDSVTPCNRSGAIDNTQERRLIELTVAEEDSPPRSKIRSPLYEAKVDPDIYFFGFDLSIDEAKGESGEDPNDDPGWFFVFKERPGEPRFGLDIDKQPKLNVWNDLSWSDVLPNASAPYIRMNVSTPTFNLTTPTGSDSEKKPQFDEDKFVSWSTNMSAADLAYILYQAPVLVAIHASEMLRNR